MFASAKEKRQKVAPTASSPLAWLSRVYFSRYPANGEFARRLTVSVSRNRVLIISHITFRDCHVHLFRQPFSKQLYMRRPADSLAEISLRATKQGSLPSHINTTTILYGNKAWADLAPLTKLAHLISLFCFRCDENAKIGDKMIYASSKDTIKKSFTGLSLEFQANDGGDLDYKTLSEEVEKRAY